ncbi:MAG: hypothetical protein ACREOG_17570 [Gemmatimonadaceae bacterium]
MSILLHSLARTWTSIASLAAVSFALLVVSLVAPERWAMILAAFGLLGLMAARLVALHGGWPQRSRLT